MNKELINKYLNELQSPSLQWDEGAQCINPAELRRYTGAMDTLRLDCIQAIDECEPTMQMFYLDELKEKRRVIAMRGYANMETSNLIDYITSADNAGGMALMSYQQLDQMLLRSVDKAISIVEVMLGEGETKEEDAVKTVVEVPATPAVPMSDWMGVDEVCERYRLAKNNVKSRQWRMNNGFPTHQDGGAYSKVTFHSKEVEEWLNSHKS